MYDAAIQWRQNRHRTTNRDAGDGFAKTRVDGDAKPTCGDGGEMLVSRKESN